MNILWLSWRGPGHPLAGGAEQVAWKHMQGWIKAGHTVTLITSRYLNCIPKEKIDGVEVYRRGDQFIGVRIFSTYYYLFGKHLPYDLVVDEHHGIPFFTPLFVRKHKLGFIHEIAGKVWKVNPWPFPANFIVAKIGPILEPLILKYFYMNIPFITVSPSTANELKMLGVNKVSIIYNGVNIPTKPPSLPKEKEFTITYLSALAKDKGIEDAIEVFGGVNKIIPTSKFRIVGKGNVTYVDMLQKLVHKKGLNNSVKFYGYVSEAEKFKLLATSHLLINCSVHEGWGLVNIEANSVGTPAVGYPVSGIVDSIVYGKNGLIAENQSPEALLKIVIELATDPAKLKSLSRSAKSWSNQFTWEKAQMKSARLLLEL